MLVRKSIGLSSTSLWQRECQVSTRFVIVSINRKCTLLLLQLNFRVADLMIKPSVRMMMN
ncbi:hypothetical protein Goklo_025133, partial [Gossypium klotzschianum]|nr:hypothetical protein [Gossypium klotzschianum]